MDRLKILRDDERRESCGCGGGSCGCAGADGAAGDGAPEVDALRERLRGALRGKRGRSFWRSLEELAGTPEFEEMLHREFPRHAAEWLPEDEPGFSRRRFLQLSSASMALAGLTACTRQPPESIVPYVDRPEEVIPGEPLYYATAFTMAGYAQGVLVESHTGRPTKVEGNPQHPANPGGGTDAFAQASILQLYDPDRSEVLTYLDQIRTWSEFQAQLAPRIQAHRALGGAGLRFLTGSVASPTLGAQLRNLTAELPEARWYQWDAAGRHNVHRGAVRAFGEPVATRYLPSRADVILSLDADFLTQGPGALRYAHEWAERRRRGVGAGTGEPDPRWMNRLYALESMPSGTGTVADHRLPATPEEIARFTLALASELGVAQGRTAERLDGELARWLGPVAEDLRTHRGRAVVIPGDGMPPSVHVLAHAINGALAAEGQTVLHTEPVTESPADQVDDVVALTEELRAGEVDTLVILGTNPVFDAPADLEFAEALQQAELRIHVGLYRDETSRFCQWHVPQTHYLESWSDARSFDGTVSIVQPLIRPLYQGHTLHEVVAQFTTRPDVDPQELVRERWSVLLPDQRAWRRALHDGWIEGTDLNVRGGAVQGVAQAAAEVRAASAEAASGEPDAEGALSVQVAFRPDPSVWDGAWANNAWLQELPRQITRLTWDNAALMSLSTARSVGVGDIDAALHHERPMVRLTVEGRSVDLPVWIVPGHADGVVTVHFGQGREWIGGVGEGIGFNVYPARALGTLWNARGRLERRPGRYRMATTQDHYSMEGRHLVRDGTLAQYLEDPDFAHDMVHEAPDASMYPEWEYPEHAWGMSVDLNVCTGCSACVVACQSENNIPVVGKEQVLRGREMHWLRIDRYFEGEGPDAVVALHNQPVLCMHCEQAPCEVVCPVAATVHSFEGLNDMVYNRCVGTRYCSNNCPYKVRRFNFFDYTDREDEAQKMVRNPDVTVRSRGVMEKCTYCVQRINQARIEARVAAQRGVGDGRIPTDSIQTACQQACPTGSIVFGDINDPEARVTRRKAEPLSYALLEELGTRPRTTYLAKLTNPNPALLEDRATGGSDHGAHG